MTKTYIQIKKEKEVEVEKLITKYKVFFAFSEKQLVEGMEKIGVTDRTKLIGLGSGTVILETELDGFLNATVKLDKDYKKELKELKQIKENAILYELNNYEAFYTGRVDEVVEKFEGVYSKKDIIKVFKKFRAIKFSK